MWKYSAGSCTGERKQSSGSARGAGDLGSPECSAGKHLESQRMRFFRASQSGLKLFSFSQAFLLLSRMLAFQRNKEQKILKIAKQKNYSNIFTGESYLLIRPTLKSGKISLKS